MNITSSVHRELKQGQHARHTALKTQHLPLSAGNAIHSEVPSALLTKASVPPYSGSTIRHITSHAAQHTAGLSSDTTQHKTVPALPQGQGEAHSSDGLLSGRNSAVQPHTTAHSNRCQQALATLLTPGISMNPHHCHHITWMPARALPTPKCSLRNL